MILVSHVSRKTTWPKGRVRWVGAPQGSSTSCQVWWFMWHYRQQPNKVSYHSAKSGGHSHSRSSLVEIATWQCFLFVTWLWRDDVTSTCLICLIWFLLMDLLVEFDGHWFSGNGDTNSYINFYTKTLNWPPRSAIRRDFQNLEYWFAIPKPRTRLAEKREGNEEYSCKALCFSRKCKKQLQFKCMTCNPDWLCSDAGQNIWHKRNFGTNWTRVENSEFWFCITFDRRWQNFILKGRLGIKLVTTTQLWDIPNIS